MNEAVDSCKKNLSRTRNSWRIFLVDGLSQMTPILDNSLLSRNDKLFGMIKWGHMNVYILHENIVNQMLFSSFFLNFFFFALLVILRHPHQCARRVISDCTVLEVNTQECKSLEQTNQWLTLTFRWKLHKQRCVCERMRETRMSNLSIFFSIVIVVYNNGINLKILMSH